VITIQYELAGDFNGSFSGSIHLPVLPLY